MNPVVIRRVKHGSLSRRAIGHVMFDCDDNEFQSYVALMADPDGLSVLSSRAKMTLRIKMVPLGGTHLFTFRACCHFLFLWGLMFLTTLFAKNEATRSETSRNSSVSTTLCSVIFFIITRGSTLNFTIKTKATR